MFIVEFSIHNIAGYELNIQIYTYIYVNIIIYVPRNSKIAPCSCRTRGVVRWTQDILQMYVNSNGQYIYHHCYEVILQQGGLYTLAYITVIIIFGYRVLLCAQDVFLLRTNRVPRLKIQQAGYVYRHFVTVPRDHLDARRLVACNINT